MPTLTDYLSALVAEKLKGTSLPESQAADMVRDLTSRLTTFITLNVLTELATKNPKLLVTFQSLAKGNTAPETIRAFIQKEIPDGAAFLAKTLNDFRALYLGPV